MQPKRFFFCCLLLSVLALWTAAGRLAPVIAATAGVEDLSFAELLALIDSERPYLLLDARSPKSYADGHLPTAVNFPGYLFDEAEIPGLPPDLDLPIVAYCSGSHCGLGEFVTERLALMGYSHVFVYLEGVEGWVTHGQLLLTGRHENLPSIDLHDLTALLATGAKISLLDARAPAEFAQGAAPGAVNLPLKDCRPRGPGIPQALDRTIVVYGQSVWDTRGFHLADRLQSMGFRRVLLFRPGFRAWPAGNTSSAPAHGE